MIEITPETESHASAGVVARSKRCFVRRLSIDRYLVTPRPYAKSRRLVTFTLRHGRMFATCENYHSGDFCPANRWGNYCYHVIRALAHAEKLARRRRRAA